MLGFMTSGPVGKEEARGRRCCNHVYNQVYEAYHTQLVDNQSIRWKVWFTFLSRESEGAKFTCYLSIWLTVRAIALNMSCQFVLNYVAMSTANTVGVWVCLKKQQHMLREDLYFLQFFVGVGLS